MAESNTSPSRWLESHARRWVRGCEWDVARAEIDEGEGVPVECAEVKEGVDVKMKENGDEKFGWEDAEDTQIGAGCGWWGKSAGRRRDEGV